MSDTQLANRLKLSRESTGLTDNPQNRVKVRKQLDLVIAEIENGVFEFSKRFPKSNKKAVFNELEGKTFSKTPACLSRSSLPGSGLTSRTINNQDLDHRWGNKIKRRCQ